MPADGLHIMGHRSSETGGGNRHAGQLLGAKDKPPAGTCPRGRGNGPTRLPGDRQNPNQLTDLAGSGWSTGRSFVRGRSAREAISDRAGRAHTGPGPFVFGERHLLPRNRHRGNNFSKPAKSSFGGSGSHEPRSECSQKCQGCRMERWCTGGAPSKGAPPRAQIPDGLSRPGTGSASRRC